MVQTANSGYVPCVFRQPRPGGRLQGGFCPATRLGRVPRHGSLQVRKPHWRSRVSKHLAAAGDIAYLPLKLRLRRLCRLFLIHSEAQCKRKAENGSPLASLTLSYCFGSRPFAIIHGLLMAKGTTWLRLQRNGPRTTRRNTVAEDAGPVPTLRAVGAKSRVRRRLFRSRLSEEKRPPPTIVERKTSAAPRRCAPNGSEPALATEPSVSIWTDPPSTGPRSTRLPPWATGRGGSSSSTPTCWRFENRRSTWSPPSTTPILSSNVALTCDTTSRTCVLHSHQAVFCPGHVRGLGGADGGHGQNSLQRFHLHVGTDELRSHPERGNFHIHFRFHDHGGIKKAFTYDWRLWTMREVRELLEETGFKGTDIYWERTNPKTGNGSGYYRRIGRAKTAAGWNALIVAW